MFLSLQYVSNSRDVYWAAVGVEYDARGRAAVGDCHVERIGEEGCLHVVGGCPPDQSARMQVDHGGHVGPAVPRLDVRDVAAPFLVRLGGGEGSRDQVGGRHWVLPRGGGLLPRSRVASLQPGGPHQAPDTLAGDAVTGRRELGVHAPHAGVAAQALEEVVDQPGEHRVLGLVRRRVPRPPRVVPGPGYAELGTHEVHRKTGRVNPIRDGSVFYRSPFANQVATFREKSTSMRKRLISSRRRSNSARSSLLSGVSPVCPSSFAFFTHLPNVIACTSIPRATSTIDRPSLMTNSTACALYSSVKARRVDPMMRFPSCLLYTSDAADE